jgi:large subunit ribosomal protein L2
MVKKRKPTTPGIRHRVDVDKSNLSNQGPEKSLTEPLSYSAGRNTYGRITVRHRGGRQKRRYRKIDFKRDKKGIKAKVVRLEYDPNRSANIALLHYEDGEKRYILAPKGLQIGDRIIAGEDADFEVGNALPLKSIPVGMPIHNLEFTPGKGGQIVRGAGTSAQIQAKEDKWVVVKLPSEEVRKFNKECYATIGQLGNPQWKNVKWGKAGRRRLKGWRPAVRGVAQHAAAHPHGGGRGRSGIGQSSPKTPWGKKTRGKKTRKKKKSDKYIVKRRNE